LRRRIAASPYSWANGFASFGTDFRAAALKGNLAVVNAVIIARLIAQPLLARFDRSSCRALLGWWRLSRVLRLSTGSGDHQDNTG
jgi:hypothetical protein